MTKEFVVKYGKDTYTRNALTGADLQYLGLRLMPKVLGLGSVIGCVVGNKFVQGENLYSYFQCVKDVFDADYNLVKTLCDSTKIKVIGNNSLNCEANIEKMIKTGVYGFSMARAVISGNLNFNISQF